MMKLRVARCIVMALALTGTSGCYTTRQRPGPAPAPNQLSAEQALVLQREVPLGRDARVPRPEHLAHDLQRVVVRLAGPRRRQVERLVPAVLRYQACNDTVCFPPTRASTEWRLTIVGR